MNGEELDKLIKNIETLYSKLKKMVFLLKGIAIGILILFFVMLLIVIWIGVRLI